MSALVFALLLTACVNANSPLERRYEPVQELKMFKREAADEVEPMEDSIEEVNIKSGAAYNLFQGDILLTKEQKEKIALDVEETRAKRQAFNVNGTWPARKWTNGVTFILAGYLADDFLLVQGGDDGCQSYVGRNKGTGPQDLFLGEGCETFGHAAHELGHALGLFHTHTRYDRDEFIKVDNKNIKYYWQDQFKPQTKETNNNYDLAYDYGSIMHYAAKSVVAVNKDQPVMRAIDGNYTEALGSDIISFYDLLMVNTLYNCIDACEDKSQCHNGGFPHPRDCSKCICPSGFGGPLCETRPEGCGGEVDAKEDWETLEYKVDDSNADEERDGFNRCIYWIKAPSDKNVEVEILDLPSLYLDHGCKFSGLEIKANSDKRLTGYRFCAKEDFNKKLVSNSSLVPVITYTRHNSVNTKLRYRYV